MSELVSVERQGHVLVVAIDRPDKRNAWNREVIRGVAQAYTDLRDDRDLRVGVVFAHGDHFTAGLDLPDVLPALAGGDAADVLPADLCDPWDFLGEPCPKPIVVAVQGRCYTLGIELILAAQASVAASDTLFAQVEVARGIVPLGGASHRLPARLGAAGMGWLLTGDTFDASDALEAGLINEIVEPGAQVERALEIANRIAANAPLAVQAALASPRATERAARAAAAEHLRSVAPTLLSSEDAMEGMAAMLERRDPHYRGR